MRFHRAKLTRKYLKFYRIVFGINEPYDILLDGNFIFAALKHKIDLRDRLARLLQVLGNLIKLHVTRSVIQELEAAGSKTSQALEFATKFCSIIEDGGRSTNVNISTSDYILQFLESQRNKKKYMIATQDKDFRIAASRIPGIPTLYFNKVILILEPPSQTSRESHKQIEGSKLSLNRSEANLIHSAAIINSSSSSSSSSASSRPGSSSTHAINTGSSSSSSLLSSTSQGGLAGAGGAGVPPTTAGAESLIRRKAKPKAANPLSHRSSNQDSRSTQKKKKEKYKAR